MTAGILEPEMFEETLKEMLKSGVPESEVFEWLLNRKTVEIARKWIQSEEGQKRLKEENIIEIFKDKTEKELRNTIEEGASKLNIRTLTEEGKENLLIDLAREKKVFMDDAEKIIQNIVGNAVFIVISEEIQKNEQGS